MNNICPICSSQNIVISDKKLNIYRCQCSHEFTITNEMEKYDDLYFDRHKNWFKNPNYGLFNYIIENLPPGKNISLLDTGCGNGAFLKYLRAKNKDIDLYGIDLAHNKHEGINFIHGNIYTAKINKKFDVIVSLAVIEHLKDPVSYVNLLKKLAKRDGKIFIMTIDSDSLICRIAKALKIFGFRIAYERLYEYKHLNHFTKKSLKRLMEKNGFKVIRHFGHNYKFEAIDAPNNNIIYRIFVMMVFLLSSVLNMHYLQTGLYQIKSS